MSWPGLTRPSDRHCERSEAIHTSTRAEQWIASSLQHKIALQFCRELLDMTAGWRQSATATASISISHSGAASAVTPTSVLAGGSMPSKNAERALPMMGRSSGL
jgi:hypothetical protein